ncbi:hypothetical protein ALC53_01224 [Atta colombica]|uniref:Uncharacterized protein n=1 Tax=Atta colombica TaxID=520822 RepID=A0A195BW21_9HYME|nr:hypothetical protein ALC53_01224 [Atta colombica]
MPSYERILADRDEITNNLHIVFSPSCDTLLLHYAKIVKLDETARTGLASVLTFGYPKREDDASEIQQYSAKPSRIHPRESWARPLLADLSQIAEAYSIICVHPCILCRKSNARTGVCGLEKGIRRWRSNDLDTLPVRDSAMNSQTVASSVMPHVSKSASNLECLATLAKSESNWFSSILVSFFSSFTHCNVSLVRRVISFDTDGSSDRGVAQYGRPGIGIAMAILLAAS